MRRLLSSALILLVAVQVWAFEDATLRDDFNRANGALGANWSGPLISTNTSTLTVDTNQVIKSAVAGSGSHWWNVASFGPDVGVTLSTPDAVGVAVIQIYLRIANPGGASSTDGYLCQFAPNTTTVDVRVLNNSSSTVLNSNASQALANGGKIRCQMVGNTITAYVDTGGGWVVAVSSSDGTYTAGGFAGMRIDVADVRVDNFGANTMVSATRRRGGLVSIE